MRDKEKEHKKPTIKQSYKEISQKKAKEISIARKILIIVISVFILVIGIGGVSAYNYIENGMTPVDPESEETVDITIPLGSSSSDIAKILEEAGVIENSMLYRFYIKFNNVSEFQAGDYTLSPSMTLAEITDKLQTGLLREEALFSVTVPEGRKIEEIASIYEREINIPAEEFLEKMQDKEYINRLLEQYPDILSQEILNENIIYPLEGYLFPATYDFFEEEPTIETIVDKMLQKTSEVVSAYYDQMEAEEFSIHELVTLASLVEEEAPSETDRKLIASVFYNRLDQGMKLQTDPTVIYAYGEHMDRLTYDDYEIESPYNTYHVEGLPVGPIANFGESSLAAILQPANGNYLYFLSDSDGEIHYSTTYEEHQQLEDQYIHNQEE